VDELIIIGRVRTLVGSRPTAGGVWVRDGLVRAVGTPAEVVMAAGPNRSVEHRTLPDHAVAMPAFEDAHLHLLSLAATRLSVDCSVETCATLGEVLQALAMARPVAEGWLRGWGFDEALVTDRRFPTLAEMDGAVGSHPLVIHHRTGHAAVLNSAAMAVLGASSHVLDDHSRSLVNRVPRLGSETLATAVAASSDDLVRHGVTRITDAGHWNGIDELRLLAELRADGCIHQSVTAMVEIGAAEKLRFGARLGDITVGPVKIMPSAGHHDEIANDIGRARRAGFPVAVHVTDVDELEAALDAIEAHPPVLAPSSFDRTDRLEHVSLALPEQVARLAAVGVAVVTQPSFVTRRAAKYRAELSAVEHDWLYRVRSLLDAGIRVRAGSDAPVVPARPLDFVRAAVTRDLAPAERVDVGTALGMVTGGRSVAPGQPAELVVLDADPTESRLEDLAAISVLATIS